ncbi:MAG: prepilin-type N-terminal cleavage/methylation domain-containing protein [Bdellovibrionales bacterium]|nr:prepilin-type N-terminal cleavage/methylation domain-containing protein [Bdellovibrionales bacterium]
MRNQRGMTLLEVMISLAILSFMSIYTGSAIRNALSSKTRIQSNIDRQATLRDALKVMERDLNLAFQFYDPNITLYNQAIVEREKRIKEAQKKGKKTPPKATGDPLAPGATPSQDFGDPGLQPEKLKQRPVEVQTQFVGEKDNLSFTSLSNVRMRADDKVSSIAEIGYELKNCRRRTSQQKSSSCLWRRVDSYLGSDVTKGGSETVLLENVEDFSLRYIGPGHEEEWIDFWASNERGDDTTKSKFPYAVEISLEISDPETKATEGKKKKTLRMTQVAALRNPGNKKAATKEAGTGDNSELPPGIVPGGPGGDGAGQQ